MPNPGHRQLGRTPPSPAPRVHTIRVSSWEAFLGHIVDGPYANWAFRGQADATWPLITSLGRHYLDFGIAPTVWQLQEERTLRIFKRKAHALVQHLPERDGDFEWLALMEHHGAPTRLLDFTWSPYVAAFFALEQATDEAAVWAIDPQRVLAQARRAVRISDARLIDPRRASQLNRWYFRGRRPFVWIGEPERMNQRLIAQSGTFLLPSVLDLTIDRILAADPATRAGITRFVLPARAVRSRALHQLYHMNVTRASLFPGLDGLAGSLAYELEFHWRYDPRSPIPPSTTRDRRNAGPRSR